MDTKDVKKFYEERVGGSVNPYEYERWHKNAQARASYSATKYAIEKCVLPILSDGDKVLELGPGPGTWTKILLGRIPNSAFTLVDISEEMLKQAKENLVEYKNIEFVNSDILDFKPQEKYDFFFSSRIIEYVPDKEYAFSIILDAMSQGAYGYVITKTPHPRRFFKRQKNTPVHQNQIAPDKLKELLLQLGAEVVEVKNVTTVFPLMNSGLFDAFLNNVSKVMPFFVTQYFSESYCVVFKKL